MATSLSVRCGRNAQPPSGLRSGVHDQAPEASSRDTFVALSHTVDYVAYGSSQYPVSLSKGLHATHSRARYNLISSTACSSLSLPGFLYARLMRR